MHAYRYLMHMIGIDMVRMKFHAHLVVVEVTKVRNSWFSCAQQFQVDSSLRLCVRVCARVCVCVRVCVRG